jgi:antitoxin ParD1/3/4
MTMDATSLNISLPKALKDYVEIQLKERGYSTASEYLRELIRDDQRRRAVEKLELLALEGLASGNMIEATPEYWQKKHRDLARRLKLNAR